jgi:hypothetical protein
MLRHKLLLALVAFFAAVPAFAQAYGPDGQQPRVWIATPSNPANGTVAYDAYEPAAPTETVVDTDWLDTASAGNYLTGPTNQRKFRTQCRPSKARQADPILGFGQFPFGHRHQFNGHANPSENDTTALLRANPSSTCAGGPLNATDYWEPEMLIDLSTGVSAGIPPYVTTFYYVSNLKQDPLELTWLRRNFGFIGGANPADYNDTARRNELAAAGMVYFGSPETPAGFMGWQCMRGSDGATMTVTRVASQMKSDTGAAITTYSRHLRAPDGSDPWGGTCTGSNAQPGVILLELQAEQCWDGHNARSPNGRDHVAYWTRTPDSAHTHICPNNWVKVPQLQAKTEYHHAGFADYGQWYVSSDRMNPPGTPGDPSSLDPCRQTGPWFCNGSTAHFDWIYGWKGSIIDTWQRECLGISVRGVAPTNGPAECDSGTISSAYSLKAGGTSPDPTLTGGCSVVDGCVSNYTPGNAGRYNPVVPGTPVTSGHFHNHSMNDNLPMQANDNQLAGAELIDFDLRRLGR